MSVYRALQAARFLPSLASAAPYTLSRSFIKFSRFGLVWAFIQLSGYALHLYINRKQIPMKSLNVETFPLTSASWLQFLIGLYSFLKDALCQKNIIEVVRSLLMRFASQAKKIVSALLEKNIRHTARINRGRREIFTMSLYMALRPLEFSALGFFSVDFSLIYTIFAATVSYLALSLHSRAGA